MKKVLIAMSMVAMLLTSCGSGDDTVAVSPELNAVSEKLSKLQMSEVQSSQKSLDDKQESSPLSRKTSKVRGSETSKKADFCKHEETYNESLDGAVYTGTDTYFDLDGNKITSCQSYESDHTVKSVYSITKEGAYKHELQSQFTFKDEEIVNGNSITTKFEMKGEMEGTLNYNGEIFKILKGTSISVKESFTFDLNSVNNEQDFDDSLPEITSLYKIEFEAKGGKYHFDMILDENDFSQERLEKQFKLFNSKNQHIGNIKFILDETNDEERFEVYDLNGSKA